jgi:hypothetical protein
MSQTAKFMFHLFRPSGHEITHNWLLATSLEAAFNEVRADPLTHSLLWAISKRCQDDSIDIIFSTDVPEIGFKRGADKLYARALAIYYRRRAESEGPEAPHTLLLPHSEQTRGNKKQPCYASVHSRRC